MNKRLTVVLASRRMPLVAAMIATVLTLPALLSGEALDDLFHRALLRPEGPVAVATSDHGIFGFLDQNHARTDALKDLGMFPWWTGEHTRISFFRPLAELTHRADYALWPNSSAAMHLHSLVWAALLVFAVGVFYRRVLGHTVIAGLATLLYAIDDAHGLPIGWIANRNAILAALFGVLALSAHDRWRRGGQRGWAPVAFALLALSLCSAEAGIATTAYLFAHALFLDPAHGWRKLLVLAPYGALVVGWRSIATLLGYGADGSALYIDPVRTPLRFLEAVFVRAPVLLSAQWGPIPSEVDGAMHASSSRLVEVLLAIMVIALVAWAIVPKLRGDAVSRFFALGMVLSVLPISATFPSDRLLFFVGIGAMGLLGRALPLLLADRHGSRARRIGIPLVGVHLCLAPIALPLRSYEPKVMANLLDPCTEVPADPAISGQRLIVVNGVDSCTAYIPLRAAVDGTRAPINAQTLASGVAPMKLTRVTDKSLLVERDAGWFITTFEMVFWDPDHRWSIGETREQGGMRAEIREITRDGRPRAVLFTFDVPLEDASVRWMKIDPEHKLVPVSIPGVGEPSVTIAQAFR
jgi:hypothetical protein